MSVYVDPTTGQFQRQASGALKKVAGAGAVAQSVYMRLSTRKGSVLWDPHFGSRLHEVLVMRSNTPRQVEVYIREALRPMEVAGELQDLVVSVEASGRNRVNYAVSATDAGKRPVVFSAWVQLQ